MRFIVYGLGAIGGAVAAHLVEAGADVAGVARGAHLEKIRADGLRLLTPTRSATVRFPVAEDPAALRLRPEDLVILAVKSQDTAGALEALSAARRDITVACFQNGVANERAAARYFERVYGVVVMCPATHLQPGVVAVHSTPVPALFDVGRFPTGDDSGAEGLAATLAGAGFDTRAVPDVMRWKYTKLLLNLGNAAQALTGVDAREGRLPGLARREGAACLEAALFRFGHFSELLDPPVVGLVAQQLQGIGKPVDEGLRQLRRELLFPLRDVAGTNVPAIQAGGRAEQAMIPEAILAGFLLALVESEEGQDLRPQHHRAIQPQVLVADLQAVGAIVSPVEHVFDGAAGRVLQFEKILLEGRGERVQLALVRDVVAARHRLMEPGFVRGLVVVHRRDEDVAWIPDEMKNAHVVSREDARMLPERGVVVEQDERRPEQGIEPTVVRPEVDIACAQCLRDR